MEEELYKTKKKSLSKVTKTHNTPSISRLLSLRPATKLKEKGKNIDTPTEKFKPKDKIALELSSSKLSSELNNLCNKKDEINTISSNKSHLKASVLPEISTKVTVLSNTINDDVNHKSEDIIALEKSILFGAQDEKGKELINYILPQQDDSLTISTQINPENSSNSQIKLESPQTIDIVQANKLILKRKRDIFDDEFGRSAKLRALLAILDLADNIDDTNHENAFLSETLVSSALLCEEIPIPKSYKDAINDATYGKMWKEAIDEEIRALLANQTWDEVYAPSEANLISSKWVFTTKLKPDGLFDRFKARLVARGFTQRLGTDYQETFAPTVQMVTLRAFLAITGLENLELSHFDIKSAFTEAKSDELLFLRAPGGVNVQPGHALRINRSLHGLKQAARDWNKLLKTKILEWGFFQSLADPCLFTNSKKGTNILVYVDDIAIASKTKEGIEWLYNIMSKCFNIKSLV